MAVDKPAKIYVTGHRGMVGSAILQDLQHCILVSMDRQGPQPRDDEEFPVIKTVPRFFPPQKSRLCSHYPPKPKNNLAGSRIYAG